MKNLNHIKTNKQSGFSGLLVVIALAAIVGVFVLYFMKSTETVDLPIEKDGSYRNDGSGDSMMNEPVEYEEIAEDETTPESINNETLDELDSLMMELDSDTTMNADLDELEL